jgi:hypothetical protein
MRLTRRQPANFDQSSGLGYAVCVVGKLAKVLVRHDARIAGRRPDESLLLRTRESARVVVRAMMTFWTAHPLPAALRSTWTASDECLPHPRALQVISMLFRRPKMRIHLLRRVIRCSAVWRRNVHVHGSKRSLALPIELMCGMGCAYSSATLLIAHHHGSLCHEA